MRVEKLKTRKYIDSLNVRHNIESSIASVALAIEALEVMLINRGILEPDELMKQIKFLFEEKARSGDHMPGDDD